MVQWLRLRASNAGAWVPSMVKDLGPMLVKEAQRKRVLFIGPVVGCIIVPTFTVFP